MTEYQWRKQRGSEGATLPLWTRRSLEESTGGKHFAKQKLFFTMTDPALKKFLRTPLLSILYQPLD